MLELGLKALLCYLLGSLMGSLLLGRLRGVDIRELGSGNPGGTNALRTQGKAFALGVMLIDVGKGYLAAGVLPGLDLPGVGLDPAVDRAWLEVACGFMAVVGHVWPLWYEFRGGKGVGTLAGAVLAIAPWLLLPLLVIWLLVLMGTGYVGLASMLATLASPIVLLLSARPPPWPLLALLVVMAAFIIWTHRSNIARMRAGSEHRARRLWLLAPRDGAR